MAAALRYSRQQRFDCSRQMIAGHIQDWPQHTTTNVQLHDGMFCSTKSQQTLSLSWAVTLDAGSHTFDLTFH
jgi:hypothetical protein